MLTQNDIKSYFNQLLGSAEYIVYLGAKPAVTSESRIEAVLSLMESPFTISGTDITQYTATLLFDLPLAGNGKNAKLEVGRIVSHISNVLVGIKEFEITDNDGNKWYINSEISLSDISSVRMDTGMIKGVCTASGNLLVSNGELIFNRIKYYINGTRLICTAATAAMEKGARRDKDLTVDTDRYDLEELTLTNTHTLTVLFRNQELERNFIKWIDGDKNTPITLNSVFTLKIDYNGLFSTESKVKLLSGDFSGQQGAFVSYSLSFEYVEE